MPPRNSTPSEPAPRRRPATTPEAREQQMIALADALAEKQMRDGTASAQVITHYLKLGTTIHQLEQEKLRSENLLKQAQIEQMASSARIEELYGQALEAMSRYSGQTPGAHDD